MRSLRLPLLLLLPAILSVVAQAQELDSSPRKVIRDPAYFRDQILPVLDLNCFGCHDAEDPANETRHRLVPPGPDGTWSPDDVQANYEMVVGLLDEYRPERSRYLLKLLPPREGGLDHDGGWADGGEFDAALMDPAGPLVNWALGGSAREHAPVAAVVPLARTIPVGGALVLDASPSRDPDLGARMMGGGADTGLRYTWTVVEAPVGAKAQPRDPHAARTTLTPDREGPWHLTLHVHDGKLWSWPVHVKVAAVEGETAPSPSEDELVAGPIPEEQRTLIRRLCLDLWGRSPTERETRSLAALTHEERVERLLDDPATWANWFGEESFYFLLIDRFRPVSDRLSQVPEKLRKGHITFREAHMEFALSAEFNARNPGNDTYVTVVLEQFLGLEVQREKRTLEAGKKMYDGEKSKLFGERGATQADVVKITLAQEQYVELFARRMARRYLGRELTEDELRPVRDELLLAPDHLRDILARWLTSPEYADPEAPLRPKSDHQFIRGLYVDLMARPPSYDEFRNMRNALQALADPEPLRGVLARVMLESDAVLAPRGAEERPREAGSATGSTTDRRPGEGGGTRADLEAQVTDLFHRFLGRDPTGGELDVFVETLQEPGVSWRTAALALLVSPEYQRY